MVAAKKKDFSSDRHRGPNRVVLLLTLFIGIAVVGGYLALQKPAPTAGKRYEGGNYYIGETRDYQQQTINMTTIDYKVENGKIYLPLEEVKTYKLVYTTYQGKNGEQIPLMAYITPKGRVVAAFAMCEPCRSLSFHIQDNTLVCDTCASRWELENLEGISGGCTAYPPEEMPYEVEGDQIILDEELVKSWTPRV